MKDLPKFTEIYFPGRGEKNIAGLVSTWNHAAIDCNVRVYYSPTHLQPNPFSDPEEWRKNKRRGFDFYVTNYHCRYLDAGVPDPYKDRDYDDPEIIVECLLHGTVAWDGMRHLYMGDEVTDTEGYLYCVKPELLCLVFAELSKLQWEYCVTDQLRWCKPVKEIVWGEPV